MAREEPTSDTGATARDSGRLTFQSAIDPEVAVSSATTDVELPDVVIPVGAVPGAINRVYAAVAYRKSVEASSSPNAVNGEQFIQVKKSTSGVFQDAVVLPDNSLQHAADATEGGSLIAGDIDVSEEVDGVGTYNLQWEDATVDGDSITFHDLQAFLVVEYV